MQHESCKQVPKSPWDETGQSMYQEVIATFYCEYLGGGFKDLLLSPLQIGEMMQIWLILFRWVVQPPD